jgi:hypothetical protein
MGWLVWLAFLAADAIAIGLLRRRGLTPRDLGPGLLSSAAFGVIVGLLTFGLLGLEDIPHTDLDRLAAFVGGTIVGGSVTFLVYGLLRLIRARGAGASGGIGRAVLAPILVTLVFVGVIKLAQGVRDAGAQSAQDTAPFEIHDRANVLFDATLADVERASGHPVRIIVDLRLRSTADVRFVPDSGTLGTPGICLAERRVGQSAQGPCWIADIAAPVPSVLPKGYDKTTRISFTPPPVGLGSGDRFDLYLHGSTADDSFDTFGATTFIIEP